jgi:transcriptional regulator with XRE-family HTH domain
MRMDIKEKIGNRITQSRKAKGITIKELSERLNGTLSPARISNWEQGTRSPGPTEAKLLAIELEVSASYLLCLTDKPEGELSMTGHGGTRFIPVLTMKEAPHAMELIQSNTKQNLIFDSREKTIVVDHFNKSNTQACLFAVLVEDASMEPVLNVGNLVIINADQIPQPGDIILAYLTSKKQVVLRQYGESSDSLFLLLANNELWVNIHVKHTHEAIICGVVCEYRKYC